MEEAVAIHPVSFTEDHAIGITCAEVYSFPSVLLEVIPVRRVLTPGGKTNLAPVGAA